MADPSRRTLFLDLDGTIWDERPVRGAIEAHLSEEQVRRMPRVAARQRKEKGYYTWTGVYRELDLDYMALLAEQAARIRLPAGHREALQDLAADWKVWIATDGAAAYTCFKLERLGIGSLVTGSLPSCRVGAMKADRVWWSRAVDIVGCEPAQAAAVGDSLTDVTVPLELGMKAVWITDDLGGPPPLPGLVRCRSLRDVPGLLRGLVSQ